MLWDFLKLAAAVFVVRLALVGLLCEVFDALRERGYISDDGDEVTFSHPILKAVRRAKIRRSGLKVVGGKDAVAKTEGEP